MPETSEKNDRTSVSISIEIFSGFLNVHKPEQVLSRHSLNDDENNEELVSSFYVEISISSM